MRELAIVPSLEEFEQQMELAKKYDCQFEYNDFIHSKVLSDPWSSSGIIEEYAKRRTSFEKDTIHGAFYDIYINSNDHEIRKISQIRMEQSMEIAKAMGARGVVFHTGLLAGFELPTYTKSWLEYQKNFYEELAEKYPNQSIFVENMFEHKPELLQQLALELSHIPNFYVCLDYGHSVISPTPVERWVEVLGSYVGHIHINDNDKNQDLHLPIGEGEISWETYHQLVKKLPQQPSVLVEVSGFEQQKKSMEQLEKNKWYPFS